eukprot:5052771-Prorocentrum_lima.AAC.1
MVGEAVVADRSVRAWLNAECGLQVRVHAGRKARGHPGFLSTSPAEVSLLGVAMPWGVLCDLPPGGTGLVGEIAALNLLRLVQKEAHMRRTLTRLHA